MNDVRSCQSFDLEDLISKRSNRVSLENQLDQVVKLLLAHVYGDRCLVQFDRISFIDRHPEDFVVLRVGKTPHLPFS